MIGAMPPTLRIVFELTWADTYNGYTDVVGKGAGQMFAIALKNELARIHAA